MERRPSVDTNLRQLFKACDLDGSGYLDKSELAKVCTDLSSDELTEVFRELDKDADGKISVEEFARGFRDISSSLLSISRAKRRQRLASQKSDDNGDGGGGGPDEEFVGSLHDGLKSLSCQEQICELYQHLHESESPYLLPHFESIVLGVLKDVRQIQQENERLEKSFKREKEQHERLMRQMEEETENQVQKIESRVRKEMLRDAEQEKIEMKTRFESEINMLHENLKKLQSLETMVNRDRMSDGQLSELKSRLEELYHENRHMKSSLTDAQTSLALARSELATMRQEYKDKCHELQIEKDTVTDYIREQDNLTRQLHMLHDANKKLHDTNDDLRAALEQTRILHKRNLSGSSAGNDSTDHGQLCKQGSVLSSYLDSPIGRQECSLTSSLAEEFSMTESRLNESGSSRRFLTQESCDVDSMGDLDSGHSTMRDFNELDTESECLSYEGDKRRRRRPKRLKALSASDSEDEMDTGTESPIPMRPGSSASRGSGSLAVRRQLPLLPKDDIPPTPNRDPERMYKVVLAGDAAVGKSSFIMRLCKGKFVNNISSTLGVDFQTKIIEVDGRTVALQLWDTAGQERFRSIAKSYFRRADGVLLLYDCTYERSFLNVREWIEAIEDGAQKKIPMMLCGNKTDLREDMENQGRRTVRFEDGVRLAREFDALFIETSAKSGDNIHEAVLELARLLRTNEDIEVKSVGMQLESMRNQKKSGCCN
ncbi:ras and EF-hand domain-containing protein homolog [Liolophura sinensis]|uniref:ras and EF-hand domain-containing protein homolog n=1 Tax=Liolophura sinensis TaxID=3198878 RepID=UPI00315864B1